MPSVHEIDWQDGDVVLLAVKSQDTYPALSGLVQVAPASTPVVCLQNGVANESTALRWFEDVYGVVVMLPATHLEPGVVAQHSSPVPGLLDVGRWPAGAGGLCTELSHRFGEAGFDTRVLEDVARWKYAKLLANLSNVVGALCGPDERHGRITGRPARQTAWCRDAGQRSAPAPGSPPRPPATPSGQHHCRRRPRPTRTRNRDVTIHRSPRAHASSPRAPVTGT